MNKRAIVISICLLLLFGTVTSPAASQAQADLPARFTHLSVQDGLSDASVIDMIQDEQGFIWFGTQNGLNRYDGYEFVVYAHDPNDPNSLSHNNVTAVYQDPASILWIGTRGGGLNRLDPKTGKISRYQHQPDDVQTLSGNFVNSVIADVRGNLWVSTASGLNYFDVTMETAVRYPIAPAQSPNPDYLKVKDAVMGADQTVWMATGGGLAWLAPDADDISYSDGQIGIHDVNINDLQIDHAGFVWAGTNDGLYKLDADKQIIAHYQYDPDHADGLGADVVWTIYEDSQQRLWLGTRGGGLTLFDPVAETFTHYRHDPDNANSLSGDFVLAIYEDEAGTLWVSSWATGLNLLSPYKFKFPPSIPVQSLPLAIYEEENGRLWIGTLERGLAHIDPATGDVNYYQHDPDDPHSLSNDTIFAMQPAVGGLWLGTLGGLNFFDPVTETFTRYPADSAADAGLSRTSIRSIHVNDDGAVWMGTRAGLYRFEPENGLGTGRFTPYNQAANAPTSNISAIHQTSPDSIWLGVDNGLYQFNPQTETFQNYAQASGSQDISITVIHQDPNGILWLGTWGQGLIRFDPANQTSIHYQGDEGLPGSIILGILPDSDGHLWLSTNKGISHFDSITEQFRTYDKADGLEQDNFAQGAYWQNEQGEIFFGTKGVIVHFHPKQLRDNPYVPPVYLTNFQLFNQSVAVGADSPLTQNINHTSEIVLSPDQSVFSFEFAALNFISPNKNQYAYKMDGVDPDWNLVNDRRFVTYTNLDPGEYHFYVRAANNDGVWNDEGVDLQITVRPPWWRSWGAYLLYAVALALSLVGYNQYRTRLQTQELANQRRELLWERRLRESLEQLDRSKDEERARIARELHDGLAQTLAGIRFRTRTWKTLINRDPDRLLPEFDELSEILDISIQDVRRSIYALRPLFLEELGLETAVSRFTTDLAKLYQVDIQTEFKNSAALPNELEHDLFRIIQELLYNAVQHGRPQTVRIKLDVMETAVSLQITDDGIGFDTQHIPHHHKKGSFGLTQARERVELAKGTMALTSELDEGTAVSIQLPIR